MEKLKPCPFCGRTDLEIVKFHDRCYAIVCKCGCESPHDSVSEAGVIRIWNRRRI
jgi:Lar family restriction alleviation protein